MTGAMALRFRPSRDALATRVGDEIVLVHTVTDRIYVLNRTGARVWELLCGELDQTEIESRLAEEFDVAHADLARRPAASSPPWSRVGCHRSSAWLSRRRARAMAFGAHSTSGRALVAGALGHDRR